ncbi:hypothetical protein KY284_021150 [Solanum tuberosum]|nr:hypothetical protein KY284_021150 [Solanum tuberosum]
MEVGWGSSKKEKEDGKFNEEEEEKGDAVVIEAANLKRKKEGEASKRRNRIEMGVSKKEKLKRWGVRRRRKRWCKWWLKVRGVVGCEEDEGKKDYWLKRKKWGPLILFLFNF